MSKLADRLESLRNEHILAFSEEEHRTFHKVLAALRASQKPSEPKRFLSGDHVFRHYGVPVCDCDVQHRPSCASVSAPTEEADE